jgi:hypothetical protein
MVTPTGNQCWQSPASIGTVNVVYDQPGQD